LREKIKKKLNYSNIRSVKATDLPFLINVVDSSGLFPGEMLTDMIGDNLDGSSDRQYWVTYAIDKPVAIAYFAPEQMTSGTWNLYLIAVHADHQGSGIGTQLMNYVENFLQSKGERILIVETSDLKDFEPTRKFYEGLNYGREAHIKEFYDEGEGKVIFTKKLNLELVCPHLVCGGIRLSWCRRAHHQVMKVTLNLPLSLRYWPQTRDI